MTKYLIYIVAAVAFALGAAAGWWATSTAAGLRVSAAQSQRDKAVRDAAELSQRLIEQRAAMTEAARRSEREQRDLEQQYATQASQEADYVRAQLAKQLSANRSLGAELERNRALFSRLLDHFRAFATGSSTSGEGATAADGGEAGSAAGLVQADLCGRLAERAVSLGERAASLAQYADRADAKHAACERIHEGLTTP